MNTLKIRRAITPALLCGATLCIPALALAAPPDDEPALQRPGEKADTSSDAADPPPEDAPAEAAPGEADSAGGDSTKAAPAEGDPTEAAPAEGDSAEGGTTEGDPGVQASAEGKSEADETPEEEPGKFDNLLGGEESPDSQGDSTPRTFSNEGFDSGISEDEKLARYYSALYRPSDNPGRIFFATRALFTNQSAQNSAYFGRAGGVQLEVGQTWNKFGYGVAGSVYGGLIQLGSEAEAIGSVMVGGGPSLSLGRLALVRRGFIDLRAGYDFFYVPLQSTGISPDTPRAIAPHGFRVSLDLGLLLRSGRGKKLRHGVGLSLGYQGFVGSLVGGRLPYTSSLMTGLSYFFG